MSRALSSLEGHVQKCSPPTLPRRQGCRIQQTLKRSLSPIRIDRAALVGATLSTALVAFPVAASELILRSEPANALSLPTWIIHVSSVLEWVTAMGLIWQYGEVSGNPKWKGMTWGMLPCLGGALCACTWHFFYNSPELEFLVTLQSALTFVGNCTCGVAAYRIYNDAQQTSS